jgi:hypothetical protein
MELKPLVNDFRPNESVHPKIILDDFYLILQSWRNSNDKSIRINPIIEYLSKYITLSHDMPVEEKLVASIIGLYNIQNKY